MFGWPRAWMVGANGTVVHVSDEGVWSSADPDATSDLFSIRAVSSSGYYIGGAEGLFRYTSNSGASWQSNDLPDTTQNFVVDRFVQTWYALGDKGALYTTTSFNGVWTARESGTTSALRSIEQIGQTLIAVGDGGVLIRSDLNGEVWTLVSTGTTANLNAIITRGANTWLVFGDDGLILKSTDDGVTWQAKSSGTTATLRAASATVAANGIVVVGDDGTVLETTDAGDSWCSHYTGIAANLYAVSTHWSDRWYAAGEGGAVIFSSDKGAGCSTVAIESDTESSQGFELSHPWPNPTFVGTPARFTLSANQTQRIRADVFDVVGRHRAVMVDRVFAPGESVSLTVEGAQLPAGRYFVRVQGRDAVQTRMVTIVK